MKAITILQPWASLIACGAKKIETRSWPTKYRGPIAIHAGKALTSIDHYTSTVEKVLWDQNKGCCGETPLGKVLAIADLVNCVEIANLEIVFALKDAYGKNEIAFGDYTPGRYAWILDNVRRIDPIPAKGQQGLWNWDRGGPGE